MILSAIAIPTLMRAYRSYELNDAATRVASIMKFTRFEAIRKNTTVSCQAQQSGTNWSLNTQNNGVTAAEVALTGIVTFLPSSSVPNTSPITTALGSASPALTTLPGSITSVAFDGRGAVSFGANPPAVYVFFLGNTTIPDMGARAVVLLPSGMVQVWTVGAGGNWKPLS
jgi:Tfp pilus assembly protein FimT